MSWVWATAASFFGAVISALGMGGGGILLIYLTAYLGMSQLEAQGINLVFFLPVAAVALVIHAKHKLIRWKVVLPFVALGLPAVWLGRGLPKRRARTFSPNCLAGFCWSSACGNCFPKPPPNTRINW